MRAQSQRFGLDRSVVALKAVGRRRRRMDRGRVAALHAPHRPPTAWPMRGAGCCARSARGCRSIASAAPTSPPPFPKNRRRRSRPSSRRLGQSRPRRRRVRPSRPLRDLDIRSGPGRLTSSFDEPSADRVAWHARRRQAGAGLRRASRQLGTARAGGRSATARRDVLYRPPNIRAIADAIVEIRAGCMGTLVPTGLDAPIKLARALRARRACRHAGRSVRRARRRRDVLRPHLQGQSADRAARPPHRLPDPRHPRGPAARRQSFLGRIDRADRAAARRRGQASTSPAPCRPSPPWSKAGCASIPSNGCGCTAAGGDERSHLPVLIRVHSRFISRWSWRRAR